MAVATPLAIATPTTLGVVWCPPQRAKWGWLKPPPNDQKGWLDNPQMGELEVVIHPYGPWRWFGHPQWTKWGWPYMDKVVGEPTLWAVGWLTTLNSISSKKYATILEIRD